MRRTTLAVVVCAVYLAALGAAAQDLPRAIKVLDTKRAKYEQQADTLRAQIERDIEAAAAGGQENLSQSWTARGEVPEIDRREVFLQRYSTLAAGLQRAMGDALKQLSADGDTANAEVITARLVRFEGFYDLVPWGANIITTFNSTLSPGSAMVLGLQELDDFRLEVIGSPVGEGGTLEIGFPLDDQRLGFVSTTPDKDGRVHLILSVVDGEPLLEHGDPSIAIEEAGVMPTRAPGTLRVFGGDWLLESVRAKPLIDGGPPPLKGVAQREAADHRGERQTAADLIRVGEFWEGVVTHNLEAGYAVRAEVISVTDDTIKLQSSWRANARVEITFDYSGTQLRLRSIRTLSGSSASRTDMKGEGEVRGDRLSSSFDYKSSWGSTRDQPVTGRIELRRE